MAACAALVRNESEIETKVRGKWHHVALNGTSLLSDTLALMLKIPPLTESSGIGNQSSSSVKTLSESVGLDLPLCVVICDDVSCIKKFE